MRGRDALARLRCALLGVVDGAGELMERVGLDLLLFRWVVCVDDLCRSPQALKELEPTSKARLAPTFLAAVLSQPWPLLLRRGRPPRDRVYRSRQTALTGARPSEPQSDIQRKIDNVAV